MSAQDSDNLNGLSFLVKGIMYHVGELPAKSGKKQYDQKYGETLTTEEGGAWPTQTTSEFWGGYLKIDDPQLVQACNGR